MDPMSIFSMLPALGSAAQGLWGLFGGDKASGKNPADVANQRLSQIPGQTRQYYQPYMDAGRRALGNVQGQYENLTNDPNAMYSKLAQGYEPSKGYQFQLEQALNAAGNRSAAGGMAGTPQDQQQAMQVAQGLSSQDFEKYLNHMMGLYGAGLQGQQGIENQGYGASTDYGNMLANNLQQQAQYDYAGQDWQNQNQQKSWQNIFQAPGQAYGGYMANKYVNNMFNQSQR